MLFLDRSQPSSDLRRHFETHVRLHAPQTAYEIFQCFSLDKLHRIKIAAAAFAQMKHRDHVRMPDACRRSGFPLFTAQTASGKSHCQSGWRSVSSVPGFLNFYNLIICNAFLVREHLVAGLNQLLHPLGVQTSTRCRKSRHSSDDRRGCRIPER
jgi:hypothetical protein